MGRSDQVNLEGWTSDLSGWYPGSASRAGPGRFVGVLHGVTHLLGVLGTWPCPWGCGLLLRSQDKIPISFMLQ